jgi:hypothetical protein
MWRCSRETRHAEQADRSGSCGRAASFVLTARGYLAVGGPLSSPGMAYWMVVCSVYSYIAVLGANIRICRPFRLARYPPSQSCYGGAATAGSLA